MFFSLSKIFWWFVSPGNVLLILILATAVLAMTSWRRLARGVAVATAAIALLLAVVPVGGWLNAVLENRFQIPAELPQHVDGIVTLGGVVDQYVTKARGQPSLTGSAERLTEFVSLAKRYPAAKLVFSGGSGRLLQQDLGEADVIGPLFSQLGLPPERIMFEGKARNTVENAVLSKALAVPKPGENWILITSAFHMPRAVGCFRAVGWSIVPYPVDFTTTGHESFGLQFNLLGGIGRLESGLHEWLGLVFYRLTGRTDSLFPKPDE